MKYIELIEGITIRDKKVNINYNDPRGVSTHLGKKDFTPYIRKDKTLSGYTVYSVYASGDEFLTNILLALKGKSSDIMNSDDYQKFLTRSAIFLTAKVFSPNNIDIIVTPKSSSEILNDLIKHIAVRNPHIEFLPSSFVKTADISKIEIDYSNPTITDKIARTLLGIIKAAQVTGKFEIKKALPQNRKFFKNFFEIIDPELIRKFQGKNICVLDDVLSSGTTIMQIMSTIANYNPKNVIGTTLFKTI